MKSITAILTTLFVILTAVAQAAIVIVTPTEQEANDLIVSAVYRATAQGGGTSGGNSEELVLSNESTMVTGEYNYSFPETFSIFHDETVGRVVMTIGSVSIDLPVLGAHNAILIELHNYNTFIQGASYEDISFEGEVVDNMFADLGGVPNVDRRLIQFEPNQGYTMTGNLSFDPIFASGTTTRIDVYGVDSNAPTIPEPSSLSILLIPLVLLFRRLR